MRQMTGGRQHRIVFRHRHFRHFGASGLPHRPDLLQRSRVGRRLGGQDHAVVDIQSGIGRLHTAFLRTGDGVPQHQIRRHRAERALGRRQQVAFDAGDIGDHGVAADHALAGQCRQFFQHRLGNTGRCGDHDDITASHGLRQFQPVVVDDAQFHAPLERGFPPPPGHHFPGVTVFPQGLGQGASDQTQRQDTNTFDGMCHNVSQR